MSDYSLWFTLGQVVVYRPDGREATVTWEENVPEDHLVKLTFADGTSIWCPSYEVDAGMDGLTDEDYRRGGRYNIEGEWIPNG